MCDTTRSWCGARLRPASALRQPDFDVSEHRSGGGSAPWIAQLAGDAAAKVAVEVLRQMLPDSVDLRAEAALTVVAGMMPAWSTPFGPTRVSTIERDRRGLISKVSTKHQ